MQSPDLFAGDEMRGMLIQRSILNKLKAFGVSSSWPITPANSGNQSPTERQGSAGQMTRDVTCLIYSGDWLHVARRVHSISRGLPRAFLKQFALDIVVGQGHRTWLNLPINVADDVCGGS